MRSTVEIICAVKECKEATNDELRLALMVLNSTEYFLKAKLERILEALEKKNAFSVDLWTREARTFLEKTLFNAHKCDPAKWLGPENTPGNPIHDQRLAASLALLEKLQKKESMS